MKKQWKMRIRSTLWTELWFGDTIKMIVFHIFFSSCTFYRISQIYSVLKSWNVLSLKYSCRLEMTIIHRIPLIRNSNVSLCQNETVSWSNCDFFFFFTLLSIFLLVFFDPYTFILSNISIFLDSIKNNMVHQNSRIFKCNNFWIC